MLRLASLAYRRTLPKSLLARLALLQPDGAWPPKRVAIAGLLGFAGKRRLGAFVLGLVASSVAGCVALALVLAVRSERHEPPRPDAIAALSPAPSAAALRAAARTGARGEPDQLPFFEATIRRGSRGEAPFPVRLVGVDGTDNAMVLLRDLPAAASLSSGKRRDNRTWVLRPDEFEHLRVILGTGTPNVFDVGIEVVSPAGTPLAKTVARVRLAGASSETDPAAPAVRASRLEAPFRTEVRASAEPLTDEARPDPRPEPQHSPRLPRPEGLSALGGPMDASPAEAPDMRRLWWSLPIPAWAPPADALSQN